MRHRGHNKDPVAPLTHHSSAAAQREGSRGEFHPFTKPTESKRLPGTAHELQAKPQARGADFQMPR